jgi:hypothetical protein
MPKTGGGMTSGEVERIGRPSTTVVIIGNTTSTLKNNNPQHPIGGLCRSLSLPLLQPPLPLYPSLNQLLLQSIIHLIIVYHTFSHS